MKTIIKLVHIFLGKTPKVIFKRAITIVVIILLAAFFYFNVRLEVDFGWLKFGIEPIKTEIKVSK